MRYATDRDDPGFMNWIKAKGPLNVYLDGNHVDDCIMADEERGEVVRYKRDDDNKLIKDGDSLVPETLYGNVVVKIGDSA